MAQHPFDQYPTLVIDAGNLKWKWGVLRDTETFMTANAISVITQTQYEEALNSSRGGANRYGFIQWRGNYYAIGNASANYGGLLTPVMGGAKYNREYLTPALIHMALVAYQGNIPKQLAIMCGHPPLNSRMKPEIIKALAGKRKFEWRGQQYEFEVVFVDAMDEITGGTMNAVLDDNGNQTNQVLLSDLTYVADLGGGTFDTLVMKNGVPLEGSYNSVFVGLHNVLNDFRDLVNAKHGKHFRDSREGLSMEHIIQIARHPHKQFTSWVGAPLDCASQWEEATQGTLNSLYRYVSDSVDGGINTMPRILLTGGGASVMMQELEQVIFKAHYEAGRIVHSAVMLDEMIYANVNGMKKFAYAMANISGAKKARQK